MYSWFIHPHCIGPSFSTNVLAFLVRILLSSSSDYSPPSPSPWQLLIRAFCFSLCCNQFYFSFLCFICCLRSLSFSMQWFVVARVIQMCSDSLLEFPVFLYHGFLLKSSDLSSGLIGLWPFIIGARSFWWMCTDFTNLQKQPIVLSMSKAYS